MYANGYRNHATAEAYPWGCDSRGRSRPHRMCSALNRGRAGDDSEATAEANPSKSNEKHGFFKNTIVSPLLSKQKVKEIMRQQRHIHGDATAEADPGPLECARALTWSGPG